MARYHRSWLDQIRGRLVVVRRFTSHAHGLAIFAFVPSNTNPSSVMAAYNGICFTSTGRLLDRRCGMAQFLLLISNRLLKHSYCHECARILPSQ